VASLSFGVSHLNTVERLKMRSGSSAARAGACGSSSAVMSTMMLYLNSKRFMV
jgi:hypothetical protein